MTFNDNIFSLICVILLFFRRTLSAFDRLRFSLKHCSNLKLTAKESRVYNNKYCKQICNVQKILNSNSA